MHLVFAKVSIATTLTVESMLCYLHSLLRIIKNNRMVCYNTRCFGAWVLAMHRMRQHITSCQTSKFITKYPCCICYVHIIHKTCKAIQCPLTLQSTWHPHCSTPCGTTRDSTCCTQSYPLPQVCGNGNTLLATSLHDLLFLETLCPLNDLKTPLSMFHTNSLCIAF